MTPEQAQAAALRAIAWSAARARQRADGMGRLHRGDGEALLVEVETQLAALIAHGNVPTYTDTQPLTAPPDWWDGSEPERRGLPW